MLKVIVRNAAGKVLSDEELRETVITSEIYYKNIDLITRRILRDLENFDREHILKKDVEIQ